MSRSPINLAQNPPQHGNFRRTQIGAIKDMPKLSQSMSGGMWINIADLEQYCFKLLVASF
jgi:hypothetical protein